MQDLCVTPDTDYSEGVVSLPNAEIRRLVLAEEQVCFADGSIRTYPGVSAYECDVQLLDPFVSEEAQKLEILRDYEKSAVCLPQMCEGHRVCICGYVNGADAAECWNCLCHRDETSEKFTDAFFQEKIEEKRVAKQAQYQQQRRDKRKNRHYFSGRRVGLYFSGDDNGWNCPFSKDDVLYRGGGVGDAGRHMAAFYFRRNSKVRTPIFSGW